MAAESLQWRATVSLKSLVAAGAITGIAKKKFADVACDDPRALFFGGDDDAGPASR